MKDNYKKITQMIDFLVKKQGVDVAVPELKLIKLIWAADRYHLRKYARTVSGDIYFAMKNGPVASVAKDIAENSDYLSDDISNYVQAYIKNYNGLISSLGKEEEDQFSETDVEALEFAWSKFGNMETDAIISFTHKYPEWKKHEHVERDGGREQMDMIDFFANAIIKDDPFSLPEDHIENAREIYLEYA